jgi:uncharacterized membrane protein YtjA (UPF0391 family)
LAQTLREFSWEPRYSAIEIKGEQGGNVMLWTILIVLLVLWALGFGLGGAAVGNLIHILLVLALVVLIVQLVTGRRAV